MQPSSAARVVTVSWVMPCSAPDDSGGDSYDAMDVQMIVKYVDTSDWHEYGTNTGRRPPCSCW